MFFKYLSLRAYFFNYSLVAASICISDYRFVNLCWNEVGLGVKFAVHLTYMLHIKQRKSGCVSVWWSDNELHRSKRPQDGKLT